VQYRDVLTEPTAVLSNREGEEEEKKLIYNGKIKVV
jgi:hypothetical protein